jgi:hypothetical protein
MQFPSISQRHSSKRLNNLLLNLFGNTRDHEEPRQYSEKRTMLEVSQYSTPNHITKQ